MSYKMSHDLATVLVKAWIEDKPRLQLTEKHLAEITSFGVYIVRFDLPARVFLANYSRPANEYCWCKRYRTAVYWLKKHGIERFIDTDRGRKEVINDVCRTEKETRIHKKALGDLFDSHRRNNQWNVCK